MNPESKALEAARKAYYSIMGDDDGGYDERWDDEAFLAALNAYMKSKIEGALPDRQMPPPKADRPAERTTKEHFLALSTGHYTGYMMTSGRTGSVKREVICFQPDPKKSTLLPLFMSVHDVHDALTDTQGRKLDVEIVA